MMKSYSSVYGPLGLVPLVLVWIYVSWLLMLLGAEIAHALQNLRLLEAEDRRQRDDEPINGLLAAQLLAAVAATHEVGGAGHPKERLVTEFGLTPDNVERVVARLKQRGLIARGARRHQRLHPGAPGVHDRPRRGAGGVPLERHRDRPRRDRACVRASWSASSRKDGGGDRGRDNRGVDAAARTARPTTSPRPSRRSSAGAERR